LPNPYLSDNFAPIGDELYAENLPVKGDLPEDLDGQFVRNGPNPQFDNNPVHDLHYHWFDGDGMLHGVNIQNGSATYVNRYVRTNRWKEEKEAGKRLHIRLGDFLSPLGAAKVIGNAIKNFILRRDPLTGKGTANTAVEFHDGRLLALVESDHPHHVQLPKLATVGAYNYDGALNHPFTAHPKVDAKTGEMMFFGYQINKPPYLHYSVVSKEGKFLRTVPIELDVPVMMHDFAVTQNYSVFMDLPFTFRPERMFEGKSPFQFEENRGSRFGILPRHAKKQSEIKWFRSASCFVFHVANCYEEGNEVVLIACRSDSTGSLGLDKTGHNPDFDPYLYRWRFNMDTGKVKESKLGNFRCEFPRVNEELNGYKNRYAYVMRFRVMNVPLIDAVVKCDFGDGHDKVEFTTFEFGLGKSAGECVFVPRKEAESEDDGYLITFVYDEHTDSSELYVLDAKQLDDSEKAVVARIALPRRVPYGFHGKWITREQIDNQRLV